MLCHICMQCIRNGNALSHYINCIICAVLNCTNCNGIKACQEPLIFGFYNKDLNIWEIQNVWGKSAGNIFTLTWPQLLILRGLSDRGRNRCVSVQCPVNGLGSMYRLKHKLIVKMNQPVQSPVTLIKKFKCLKQGSNFDLNI